mgnify:CR=1 FL=1|jgi:Family of unknown function (DUF6768)
MTTRTDDIIAQTLTDDDRAFLARLDDERGLFTQVGDVLTGPLAGWTRLIFVVTFFMSMATLYAVWMAFTVEGTRELVLWSAGAMIGFIATGFTKDWFFSRMNMLNILREVKRLQVQVALLGEERA